MKIVWAWVEMMRPEEVETEDGGMSKNWELSDEDRLMFVRLHSYDDTGKHEMFNALLNKRVRVTVEIIE